MPFEVQFETLPAGYAISSAKAGEKLTVQTMEFTSSEDGQHFVDRLEGIPDQILKLLPASAKMRPSDVSDLLAIVRPDKSATVFANELRLLGTVQPKRLWAVGDAVFKDDIADVQKLSIDGVTIPPECGLLLLFSVGWRKGLFFDFTPLGPDRAPRDYDLEVMLGQCYSQLMFQELFRISEPVWKALFQQQWFPFRSLSSDTLSTLISRAKAGWAVDDVLDKIVHDVRSQLDRFHAQWKDNPVFSEHLSVLETAAERFIQYDYVSASSILFPRIEGVMRTFHKLKGETGKPSQASLAASSVHLPNFRRHSNSPLLPDKFREYLDVVYFANFDPKDPHVHVSRNSVAHGVVTASELSAKAATIGFLIVQQLFYYSAPIRDIDPE